MSILRNTTAHGYKNTVSTQTPIKASRIQKITGFELYPGTADGIHAALICEFFFPGWFLDTDDCRYDQRNKRKINATPAKIAMAPYCSNMKKPPDSLLEKMIKASISNQRQTRFDNSIRAKSPVINTAAISPTVTRLMLPRCQRSGISRNASAGSVGLQKATATVSSSRRTRSHSDSRMVQFTGNKLRLLCVQPSTSYSNNTEEIRRP